MKNKDGVNYFCPKCTAEEIIPQETIDLVNDLDPQRCLIGPPSFSCENCGYPFMLPKSYNP